MAIYYTLNLKQLNGQVETSSLEFPTGSVTVGRAESCDIRLSGLSISMLHAKIFEQHGKLYVQDLDSFAGTKVNGKLVKADELSVGDSIQVGESVFKISKVESIWVITEERSVAAPKSEEEYAAFVARKLDYKSVAPSITTLSLLICLPVIVLYLILPLTTDRKASWSSGPIANPHRLIANDCQQCHAVPFQRVQDSSCMECHNMTEHAETMNEIHEKHTDLGLNCADCHMEHNGDYHIINHEPRLCTTCHADLPSALPKAETLAVASFAQHPEFRIHQLVDGMQKKVSLMEETKDTNPLKFNHEVHLSADLPTDDQQPLTCDSCHIPTKDGRDFEPISAEIHCQTCHSLEYDERLPGVKTPHADPDTVYEFIYSRYAALYLENEGKPQETGVSRTRPGGVKERTEEVAFYREVVNKESRKMEKEMFTRLACVVCHNVSERPEAAEGLTSAYMVEAPTTPTNWFPGAIFDHAAHRAVSCDSCHQGVVSSKETADVLLPKIADCQSCHNDTGKDSRVVSDCVMCHSFHGSLALTPDKAGTPKPILGQSSNLDKVASLFTDTH